MKSDAMKCEDIKELLTEYLDGELPADDAAAVEEHTAGCGACRAELDALRQTAALLKSLPKADAPSGLAQNVTASLDREVADHRRAALMRWMHVGGWLSAAAAVIIVIQLVPWQRPPDSIAPSAREMVKPAPAADEVEEKDSARKDAVPSAKPGPPPGALKKEIGRRRAETKRAERPEADAEARRTLGKLDAVEAEGVAAKGRGPGRKAAAVRSIAPGKSAGGPADSVRLAATSGKAAVGEKVEVVARAKAKVAPLAETKAGLAAAAKNVRFHKRATPLTLTYECSDVKVGRAAVLKALKAVRGATFEQDAKVTFAADQMAKAATTNVIAARVPRDKLPALVAALKLAGWPPPKDADEKGEESPAGQRPAIEQFGGKAAPKPNAALSLQRGDTSGVQSPREAGVRAGGQATTRQAVRQRDQTKEQTFADTAQEAPLTLTIRIILKVKPKK